MTQLVGLDGGPTEKEAADEMLLAKTVAETLHATYPGQLWAVSIDAGHRIVVYNLNLSGEWGFRIDIPAIYSASELVRKAKLAGGEILERFSASRTSKNVERTLGLKRDFSGRFHQESA